MNQGKKQKLIDAAIAMVAEGGMENFSMAKAAARAETSERLVYNHFGTKEAFLEACLEDAYAAIANAWSGKRMPDFKKADSTVQFIRALWDVYFGSLIAAGDRTLFYLSCRQSGCLSAEKMNNFSCFEPFAKAYRELDSVYHISGKVDEQCLLTYALDAAGLFAARIIRGEVKDTADLRKSIRTMFVGGLLALLS